MRSKALWGCCVMLFLASVAGRAFAQDRSVTTAKTEKDRTVQIEPATVEGDEAPAPIQYFPLDPGTIFERHVVLGEGADPADATAGATEQLVFSNTLGTFKAAFGAGRLIADDLTVTVPGGCKLRRYEFPVVGKADPLGIGGPYTVSFALYTNCPGSVPVSSRPPLIIPGTQGQRAFPDDAPRLISFVAGPNVSLQTNMWLGVTFSRNNSGVIVGTPPLGGFSCDQYDSPGSPCDGWLGGFPGQPQASFNLEIYADAGCPNSYTGYKNNTPSGGVYNPGAGVIFADDIELSGSGCNAIAYEVAIKGVGFYTFDLRQNCDGGVIAGTENFFIIGSGTDVKIARFTFDTPIPLPPNLWMSARVSNADGGVVVAGREACIGRTADLFGVVIDTGCLLVDVLDESQHAAFSAAITCAGAAPVGACCDMFITGPNEEAVCRQVPETNCPFPPRFSGMYPKWVRGEPCDPDPFTPEDCGKAACCTPDGGCRNLTLDECNAVAPLDSERQWQRGQYCNYEGQRCPRIACLGRTGECTLPRVCPPECPPTGCEVPLCCTDVCNQDVYCCDTEWDDVCASYARELCHLRPANDVCAPVGRMEGARRLTTSPPGNTAETDSVNATSEATDPGFGCYVNNPGKQGKHTVWYKFEAPPPPQGQQFSTALLQTCLSNSPADDSLLAVFAVGDPSTPQTQCDSLIPIACSDDFQGCSDTGKNSKICARDLIPGNLYYVMVAAKEAETTIGTAYRLNISTPCTVPSHEPGDFCPTALPITNGTTPFNLDRMSLDPPVVSCIPTETVDMWYNYPATCTGTLTVETCGPSASTSPDTNLAIYDGCLCPPMAAAPACSTDAGGNCGMASKLTIDAVEGNCYKIRLADSAQSLPSGNLKISCVQADCPAGEFVFTSPPNRVVDAGRPHAPNNAAQLQGIQTINATGPRAALASCFTLCETAVGGSPNSVASVAENPPGAYTITLTRPITAGALTTITYTDVYGVKSTGRFTSHPGNVRDDATTSAADVQDLIDALNGTFTLPWGNFSGDIDRSNLTAPPDLLVTPADILEVIDLLNGAGAYEVWDGTVNPSDSTACPPP